MTSKHYALLVGFYVVTLAVGMAMSYGLAKAGHPSSVWLWRDMLGVL